LRKKKEQERTREGEREKEFQLNSQCDPLVLLRPFLQIKECTE